MREEKKIREALKYRKEINNIRKTMKVGAKIEFCYEKGHEKKDYITGTIMKKYPSIFLVKTDKWNTSLNYNDEFKFK